MGKRGRKPTKQTPSFEEIEIQETNGMVIRDKMLHPYYINVEKGSYTVFKEGSPIHEGCFTQFPSAIRSIVQKKLNSQQGVVTLNEYISRYENAVKQLLEALQDKV